jgi:hypothetical protein
MDELEDLSSGFGFLSDEGCMESTQEPSDEEPQGNRHWNSDSCGAFLEGPSEPVNISGESELSSIRSSMCAEVGTSKVVKSDVDPRPAVGQSVIWSRDSKIHLAPPPCKRSVSSVHVQTRSFVEYMLRMIPFTLK